MRRHRYSFSEQLCLCCLFLSVSWSVGWAEETVTLTQTEMVALLTTIDDRQRNGGDYKVTAYLEQKEAGKDQLAYELTIYRRDENDLLMMLFQKPKVESGKGYLRLKRNLFI